MNPSHLPISRPRTPTQLQDMTEHDDHFDPLRSWNVDHNRLNAQNLNNALTRLSVNDVSDDYFEVTSTSQSRQRPLEEINAEEKLRRRVAFFFMDPVKKFIARRQTPWKLIIQFIKIILVTIQLLVFGSFGYEHTNYFSDNEIGFQHLFMKDWDSSREINAYPPSTGAYAVYKKSEFYDFFDNAATVYFNLEDHVVNPIYKNSTMDYCVESFLTINDTVPEYDDHTGKFKTKLECLSIPDENLKGFKSRDFLAVKQFDVPWDVLEKMFINFTVKTTTYRKMGPMLGPACFTFSIKITFDNSDHDGQIVVNMDTKPQRYTCPQSFQAVPTASAVGIRLLDFVVILNCTLSFILCSRALFRAQMLCVETRKYFMDKHNSDLSIGERFQFLNLWYIMICVNDVLIIVGSVLKEMIDLRETSGDLWNYCSVFLGSGSVLVWIGMLRYLGFFDTYNVLILTIRGALPNVIRFVICAGMVYIGYTICGWVVLGPCHFKFRTLESTLECLFALINGDDMFATFSMTSDKSPMIHGFSRLYLYSFIMLFIYVILSLFIAIIMDTYEVIKEYYKKGFPKSRVDEFSTSVQYDLYSEVFINGHKPGYLYKIWAKMMIRTLGNKWPGFEREQGKSRIHTDSIPIMS